MTTQGPPEPDETQPFTHQPYGEGAGDPAPQWPTYGPAGAATPPPPPNPYGPPPTYGQVPYGQQPYGTPGYGVPGYGFAQKNSTATTSMILGIIAVASILATPFCCITLPGMLTGPFAIWTGVKAKREIDREPGRFGNRGQAVAGLATGIVATVLAVLLVIVVVVFVVTTDWDGTYDQGMY
ncbi:DUF4190 domain-containing protein [Nocardioides sp.]|uniref:DUF4190 domain-containing protein n=1 Tax=Nocardioides sp. TaxID=35761 RepID=UPI00286C0178|nr:DUF4190 domain-containing protein [Nocardioides sp.]